jgi:hypothetical protein
MNADIRSDMIYQIRIDAEKSPDDIVTQLTHALWTALSECRAVGKLDPHLWSSLYDDILRLFRHRMSYYQGCGAEHECRFSKPLENPDAALAPPQGPTYILVLKGGLLRFADAVADLAWRRLRNEIDRPEPRGQNLRRRLSETFHRALTAHLYYNEHCSECRVRGGPAERRFWNAGSHGDA